MASIRIGMYIVRREKDLIAQGLFLCVGLGLGSLEDQFALALQQGDVRVVGVGDADRKLAGG